MSSSSDHEFEEQLFEAGNKLLDAPSSVEDLLPLLDKAEYYLSRVEQSPNKSIMDSLSPCTKALVAHNLFRHSDSNVRVAVASCISEITRITAPDAPYTDEEMKEAFQLIVSSFEHLDDTSSQSYTKRTSILETVAKVRLCVVMLDLECDALILEMFQHFLKAIRDYHPENVFSSMETIMTLVIEESEDISPEMLSPILDTLRNNNEGILPIAKKLGEQVLQECSVKLKDYLGQALISLGSCVDEYSEVVRIICEGGIADNKTDAAPTVEHEVESEAASPKSEMSHGAKQTAENHSLADRVSMKQPETVLQRTRLRISGRLSKDKLDKSHAEKEAETAAKSKKPGRKRGRKPSSVQRSVRPTDSTTNGKKEPGQPVENGEDPGIHLSKSPLENLSAGADLPSDGGKDDVDHPAQKEMAIESTYVSSPSKKKELKMLEGLLKESAEPSDSEVKEYARLGKNSGGGASNEDRTPIRVKISRKRGEITDNSKTNSVVASAEKVKARSTVKRGRALKSLKVKDKKGPAKTEKLHRKHMSMPSEKDAEEKAAPSSKMNKECHMDGDQPSETLNDKGKRKRQRDEDQPVVTPKVRGRRKRTPAKEASDAEAYSEDLVGSNVKVWWPKDKAFYKGVVDSFDAVKKKHKILYTDGDVEILNLRKQRWEIIRDGSESNEGQEVAVDTHESSHEMPLRKLFERRSNEKLSAKKGKGISLKKCGVVSPTHADANMETNSSGKTKKSYTPSIGRKLVGIAQRMASKSEGSSEIKEEDNKLRKEKLKKDLESSTKGSTPRRVGRPKKVKFDDSDDVKASSMKVKLNERKDVDMDTGESSDKVQYSSSKSSDNLLKKEKPEKDLESSSKGSTPRRVGRPRKVKPGGSDNVQSTSLKAKLKESKDVDIDSGEPSDKVKSSLSKPKLLESKEVTRDSGVDPSDKAKPSSLKLKSKEGKQVDNDPGEEPSDKVNYSSLEAKQKPELRESEEVDKDSEEPSDKVKSSSLKPKLKESEDVYMDSGEEPYDLVKSNSLKQKPWTKLEESEKESEEVDKDSGEEPSDKLKSSLLKPRQKTELKESEKLDEDSEGDPSDMKSNSSKLKLKENKEADQDCGEETEKANASEKEKSLGESLKAPTTGRKTGYCQEL